MDRTVTALIWTAQGYVEEKHSGSSQALTVCDLLLPVQGAILHPSLPYLVSLHPEPRKIVLEVERGKAAGGDLSGLWGHFLCSCHAWPVATPAPPFCQP